MNSVSSVRNLARIAGNFVGKVISGGILWYGSKKVSDAAEAVEVAYLSPKPDAAAPAPVKRKPGRPKGSLNKATKTVAKKPGRPRKIAATAPLKRKPGRPAKTNTTQEQ